MEVKDQLKIRMDELGISPSELARRVKVSPQSVRFWLQGRSHPGKNKVSLVESALTCKLNFSAASSTQSTTVEDALRQSDIETFLAISKLPPELKLLFARLAKAVVSLSEEASPVDRPSKSRK